MAREDDDLIPGGGVLYFFSLPKGEKRRGAEERGRGRASKVGKRKKRRREKKGKRRGRESASSSVALSLFPRRRAAPHSVTPRPRKRSRQTLWVLKSTVEGSRGQQKRLAAPARALKKNFPSARSLAASPPTKKGKKTSHHFFAAAPSPWSPWSARGRPRTRRRGRGRRRAS